MQSLLLPAPLYFSSTCKLLLHLDSPHPIQENITTRVKTPLTKKSLRNRTLMLQETKWKRSEARVVITRSSHHTGAEHGYKVPSETPVQSPVCARLSAGSRGQPAPRHASTTSNKRKQQAAQQKALAACPAHCDGGT